MDYKDIIGHRRQIDSLQKAIDKGSVSHSYLFEGDEGLGKKQVAMVFSKSLLCLKKGNKPCNECSSCLKFDTGNHPDFSLIVDEDGLIKKEEVERIIRAASRAPFESDRKIFIIDNSHLMNLEGENGLLKTLEEPPEFLTMILVSSNSSRHLATILSRCQRIRFYPVDGDQMVDFLLEEKSIDREKAIFLSRFTSASIGRAMMILEDSEFFNRRDMLIEIIDRLLSGKPVSSFGLMDFFEKNRDYIGEILDIMIYWFRDLLIYTETHSEDLILNRDKVEILSRQSHMEFSRIEDIIKNIEQTKENIEGNINYILSIETMLLNIQEGTR